MANMGTVSLGLLFSFAVIFVVAVARNVYNDCKYQSAYTTISHYIIRPESYHIDLIINNTSAIHGESEIRLLIYSTINRIILHTYKLVVQKSITFVSSEWNVTFPIKRYYYCHMTQTLVIDMVNDIYRGLYNLHIQFLLFVDKKDLILDDKYLW